MKTLTSTIEAIVFASGDPVPVKYIVEKLDCALKDVNASVKELQLKYGEDSGIKLLVFNGKLQFASNPVYKDEIASVLVPVKEKEFTKTVLECAAIIAYKQPITKPEVEDIRHVNCDYAINKLQELGMIEPCGRKDAIGKPILYATTDVFLKRFKLNSISELPDYEDLMAQIAELNNMYLMDSEDGNYLYRKDEYIEESAVADAGQAEAPGQRQTEPAEPKMVDGFEVPDFIDEDDDLIKID